MSTVTALLTNKAYGHPRRGARRLRKPTTLACLHQTANAKATAIQERNYANRTGSAGPSTTAYIDRDGSIVRAIDPTKYSAWSQGDALVVAFGLSLAPDQISAILAVTAVILGLITRSRVSPV